MQILGLSLIDVFYSQIRFVFALELYESFFSLSTLCEKNMEKVLIFDNNHVLTSLENCEFLGFYKSRFL